MILGAEVGLLIYGFLAIFRAKFSAGKDRVVTGSSARWLGFLCLLPLPTALTVGIVWGALAELGVINLPNMLVLAGVEVGILVAIVCAVSFLAKRAYARQQELESRIGAIPTEPSETFTVEDHENPFASPTTNG